MADALAVVGVGLGVVSLILQLTDECIKRYHYFTEASRMPESFRYLRVRLQMEQQRFLGFAWEAGLLHAGGNLCESLRLNHAILQAVLIEIKTLMVAYEDTQSKYSNEVPLSKIDWNDHGEPRTNLMNLLSIDRREDTGGSLIGDELLKNTPSRTLADISMHAAQKMRKLRVILTDRKRLAWVASDKKSLETLVAKLGSLNSFLISRLDASQTTRLKKAVETSYLEMLLLRDDVRNLKILVQALSSDASTDESRSPMPLSACSTLAEGWPVQEFATDGADAERRARLRKLTTIKLDRLRIDTTRNTKEATVTVSDGSSPLIDMSSLFRNVSNSANGAHDPPSERTVFAWASHSVWVEWLDSPSRLALSTLKAYDHETRVSLLARLLRNKLPESFKAPSCLGYIKLERSGLGDKLGLVFQTPPSFCADTVNLVTLRQAYGQRPKPSLSIRISLASSLAECVRSFHSVDWLHKGLRSDNIIFLARNTSEYDLREPYVTGFELSRPDNEIDMTIKPQIDLVRDLYRHPCAQSGGEDDSYRKSYDLYSLGIILLEIIYWRPIEDILHLWPSTIKRSAVRQVKDQLLGGETGPDCGKIQGTTKAAGSPQLAKASQKGGDVFRSVVETCLAADELDNMADESRSLSDSHQRLGLIVEEQIAERLLVMKNALELTG